MVERLRSGEGPLTGLLMAALILGSVITLENTVPGVSPDVTNAVKAVPEIPGLVVEAVNDLL